MTIVELLKKSAFIYANCTEITHLNYTQDKWDDAINRCKIHYNNGLPYDHEKEECFKIQIICYYEFGILVTTSDVYSIWRQWSSYNSASWLVVDSVDYVINVMKDFMDNCEKF